MAMTLKLLLSHSAGLSVSLVIGPETAEAWKHSHNYVHHTYTNIRGKDRDLGYEIMRIEARRRI